jgi:hypothetical protein
MTPPKDKLLDLAERCEAATGPDDRIDAEIVAALNDALLKPYPPQTDFGPGQRWQFWSLDGKHFLGNEAKHPFKVLPVTASLDAAMTLAEGRGGEVTFFKDGTAKAYLWQPYPLAVEAKGTTPALALCAAALRSRSQTTEPGEG